MTIVIRMLSPTTLHVEWPSRLSAEVRELLGYVLPAVTGVNRVVQGPYLSEVHVASHLVSVEATAWLVANALLDDEQLAHALETGDGETYDVRVC